MKPARPNTPHKPRRTCFTVGVCGLDCGLCPRFYTAGVSRCPGCCGPGFWEKHPSCGVITCCLKKKNVEICAHCDEFPCARFKDAGRHDSFVTYRRVMQTLNFIRAQGISQYVEEQSPRMKLLKRMLDSWDDGRSKSFYCLAAALLPIERLKASLLQAKGDLAEADRQNKKLLAKALARRLRDIADEENVELALRAGR
jgi:hypothetical protein